MIVNGDISTECSVKVVNMKASNKVDTGNGETKPKNKKIIITGDSHVRSQTTSAKNLRLVER